MSTIYFTHDKNLLPISQLPLNKKVFLSNSSPKVLEEKKEISENQIKILNVLPNIEKVKEEFEMDPHSTPQSFLEFSQKVGEALLKAFVSKEYAVVLFQDLETCALDLDDKTTTSVQAYCLSEMDSLASYYPDTFRNELENVIYDLDPNVIKLFKKLKK